MKIDAWWDIVVKDKDGRIVQKGRKKADSFLDNFAKLLVNYFGEEVSLVDTGGTSRTLYAQKI